MQQQTMLRTTAGQAISTVPVVLLMVGLLHAQVSAAADKQSAVACDRQCLTAVLTDYERNVQQRSVKSVPFARQFRMIENYRPIKPGEPVVYERVTAFGSNPIPQAGGGGAAYMAALMKVVDGKIVRVDHFEWEGGPNASAGFTD